MSGRFSYRANKKAVDEWLSNAVSFKVEIQMFEERMSRRTVRALLGRLKKNDSAFLTTDGTGLYVRVRGQDAKPWQPPARMYRFSK